MEQTAVEWLVNEIKAKDWWYLPQSMKDEIIDQAIEMEKEQTMDFAMKFMMQDRPIVSFYNETFKSR